jgi:hypothetical protein
VHDLDEIDGEAGGATVFRDVLMLALCGFVLVTMLLLPHLNPPASAEDQATPPGNLIVEVDWPPHLDTDVDLWVQAGENQPVGYSNQSGAVFNLLRDDLGWQNDSTELNYEVAYSRGVVPGDYVLNLHLYLDRSDAAEVPVNVSVKMKRGKKGKARELFSKRVVLRHKGEEKTVFRFRVDDDGNVPDGSVHDLPKLLRAARG